MQVLYDPGLGTVPWASNTPGQAAGYLILQGDGNLVLYTPAHAAYWASNSAGQGMPPYQLVVQNDRNVVSGWCASMAGFTSACLSALKHPICAGGLRFQK